MVGAFFYERGDTMARSELSRLRHNLISKINYYNKKGYDIDKEFVNSLDEEQLRNLTTEDLLQDIYFEQQQAKYEQEQEYEYEDELEQEYEEEYFQFPGDEEMIINNFHDSYSKYNHNAVDHIDRWLEKVMQNKGIGATAQMLQDAANAGLQITNRDIYGDLDSCLVQFLAFLPEGFQFGVMETEDLMESIEDQYDNSDYWGY